MGKAKRARRFGLHDVGTAEQAFARHTRIEAAFAHTMALSRA
jgi:hypothetical protein